MNKNVLAIAIGLLASLAALAIVLWTKEAPPAAAPPAYFDRNAATEDRILALEAAVAEERNARLLLEEELLALYEEIERLGSSEETGEERVAETQQLSESLRERAEQRFRGNSSAESREQRLVAAGFSPDRAAWIAQRESELEMERMQMVFEARQSGERLDRSDVRLDPDRALRAEIGDGEYEQYLQANDRSTSVAVGTVLESSPGQRAGLQSGDEIVAYNGQRVFSYGDLSEQTMNTQAGQSVVIDIVRDGVPMQVVVDSGPIGISNRGFRGRR